MTNINEELRGELSALLCQAEPNDIFYAVHLPTNEIVKLHFKECQFPELKRPDWILTHNDKELEFDYWGMHGTGRNDIEEYKLIGANFSDRWELAHLKECVSQEMLWREIGAILGCEYVKNSEFKYPNSKDTFKINWLVARKLMRLAKEAGYPSLYVRARLNEGQNI